MKMLHNIKSGLRNIIEWLPIIWNDRDWDWYFLARIMEFKLRRMSKFFNQRGCHVNSDRDAKRMLICAILLKRLNDDNYQDIDFKRSIIRKQYDEEYLFKLMSKYMRGWWD